MSRTGALLLAILMILLAVRFWPQRPLADPSDFAEFVAQEQLSGMVLAIHAEGRLLSSQVLESGTPVNARRLSLQTPFPIASLSKPLTAATARMLVRERRLRLEDRLIDLLPQLPYAHDDGYQRITVQHLLQHVGGFDRLHAGDPTFENNRLVGCKAAVDRAVSRPLDTPPGTRMSYSNVGYCLLGAIIEEASGETYEQAVLRRFPRLGSHTTLGLPARPPGSVDGLAFGDSRLAGAAGGWHSTAPALAEQFANDARDPSIILATTAPYRDYYYGLGWRVWSDPGGYQLTHFGSLSNVFTVAVAMPDGRAAVALFLGRPSDDEAAFRRVLPLMKAALSSTRR